jgi:phage/plasmid-associated DNA primase
VKDIICSGNSVYYDYVRKWLAHLIQKPWIITTALVLRGKQGTGKGTFAEAIGKLLGSHYAPLANLDQILGKFNSHLKNSILILADEAIWGGDKKKVGALKALITEPKLFIEAKGKDGYWINNFKHLIVSSNEDWAVHLDPDDRRFFVLDIPSDRKEDFEYFDSIQKQLEKGGYEALMFDLLNEDITIFDPKVMPANYSGFDMKLESASSVDRFLYASLKEECWDHAKAGPSGVLQDLTTDKFYDNYKTWCEREKQVILCKEQVGKRLRVIIPEMTAKRLSREEDPRRPFVYKFPTLEKCRSAFEKFYKQSPEIWELS